MVIYAKLVETVDVWLFYEIVGKVNTFRAGDQGEKVQVNLVRRNKASSYFF
jgi:hypothetical protein